jgi:hypothetical protein
MLCPCKWRYVRSEGTGDQPHCTRQVPKKVTSGEHIKLRPLQAVKTPNSVQNKPAKLNKLPVAGRKLADMNQNVHVHMLATQEMPCTVLPSVP